jgi:cyclopropane fatty-acyl-phospholipid synthase-like methyltransferase
VVNAAVHSTTAALAWRTLLSSRSTEANVDMDSRLSKYFNLKLRACPAVTQWYCLMLLRLPAPVCGAQEP